MAPRVNQAPSQSTVPNATSSMCGTPMACMCMR
ncbi:hypothetical protein EDD28_2558 [Salana multivorans]|uniref:Uncharacterized protein n=1 Tax=Salana multivorans TaxID=120377 RepID=A0A3N2D069_9MICO|nr:hypothetical protein EDD28_2558 [Salana multivorans]